MNETKFRDALLQWYENNKRPLPWRGIKDPYKIWVSEVLLQQTQVSTVIPYYENFISEFPDVHALSRAPLDRVLKVCEGVGYYGRIRNLKKAAEIMSMQHGGKIPETADELQKIPGVGEYTAAAVSSIAFQQSKPVLDGNVKRVLSRLYCVTRDITKTETQKMLLKKARKLMGISNPSDFNQAMMELGALVCLPGNPKCSICPVADLCEAKKKKMQCELPVKKKKRIIPRYQCAVGIIYKNGRILIQKRKPHGFLGGLWEFPGGKKKTTETLEQCLYREIKEETGLTVKIKNVLPYVSHAYSHFHVTLFPFICAWISGRPHSVSCDEIKWISPYETENYAFPSANRKIFPMIFTGKL